MQMVARAERLRHSRRLGGCGEWQTSSGMPTGLLQLVASLCFMGTDHEPVPDQHWSDLAHFNVRMQRGASEVRMTHCFLYFHWLEVNLRPGLVLQLRCPR